MAKCLTCKNRFYFFTDRHVRLFQRRGTIFCTKCNKDVFITPQSFILVVLFILWPFPLHILLILLQSYLGIKSNNALYSFLNIITIPLIIVGFSIWWRYFAEFKQLKIGKLFAKEDIPFWVKVIFILAICLLFVLLILTYSNIFINFFIK